MVQGLTELVASMGLAPGVSVLRHVTDVWCGLVVNLNLVIWVPNSKCVLDVLSPWTIYPKALSPFSQL